MVHQFVNTFIYPLQLFFDEFCYYIESAGKYKPNFIVFIDTMAIKTEGLIRDLFEFQGINTYKIKRDQKTTEEDNINNYLLDEDIYKFLSKEEVIFMRWLLTENKNLRNKVAHCIMLPDEYDLENACFLMIAFLRLCKFQLRAKEE